MLIKNCNVVDCIGNVKLDAWILIEGERISRVGKGPAPAMTRLIPSTPAADTCCQGS
jgi:hypothetical protein